MKKILVVAVAGMLMLSGCTHVVEESNNKVSLHSVINTGVGPNGLTAPQSFYAKQFYNEISAEYLSLLSALSVSESATDGSKGIADIKLALSSIKAPSGLGNPDLENELNQLHTNVLQLATDAESGEVTTAQLTALNDLAQNVSSVLY